MALLVSVSVDPNIALLLILFMVFASAFIDDTVENVILFLVLVEHLFSMSMSCFASVTAVSALLFRFVNCSGIAPLIVHWSVRH